MNSLVLHRWKATLADHLLRVDDCVFQYCLVTSKSDEQRIEGSVTTVSPDISLYKANGSYRFQVPGSRFHRLQVTGYGLLVASCRLQIRCSMFDGMSYEL